MRLAFAARSLARAMPNGGSRGAATAGGGGGSSGGGAVVAAASKGRKGKAGPVTGSDPDRVYDKGVWKRFKYCQHCKQIIVERAKWQNCWDEIQFCSDRCRSEGKRAKRAAQRQAQEGGEDGGT